VIGRRRRDGDPLGGPGGGLPDPAAPRAPRRVQGAWETPAVVVRGPGGEVLSREEAQAFGRRRQAVARPPTAATAETAPAPHDDAAPADRAAPEGGTTPVSRRTRVRPRRIPGAAGGVLVAPTLLRDADDGRLARRARRQAAPDATVSLLPLRGRKASDVPAEPAGGLSGRLRPGRRGPAPARPGDRRPSRSLEAVAPPRSPRTPAWLRRVASKVSSLGVASAVVYVVVLAAIIYTVFPVRTYLNQRAETDRARQQIEAIERENDRLAQRAEDLRDPDTVEQLAREDLGMVKPGEESYGILPAPQQPAP
jgi:cell division protein FtsB